MGGRSAEREVSLSTGRMIMAALDADRYNAFAIDTGHFCGKPQNCGEQTSLSYNGLESILSPNNSLPRPDVVFIALHGKYGEDGTIQGLLDLLEIPYVGSGVLASALAMDKIMTRKLLHVEGIPVPEGMTITRSDAKQEIIERVEKYLGYPVVVKPNCQGSTIGLSIARTSSDLVSAVSTALEYDKNVLLEEFISGTEITAPVIGNEDLRLLPLVEIVPDGGFYDYHAKYTAGATEEIVPARLAKDVYDRAGELALLCHRVLGCRGMSRTDMIVREEEIFVLEVNTIPGMTPTSLLPRSAQAAGIEFPDLLDLLIGCALEKE